MYRRNYIIGRSILIKIANLGAIAARIGTEAINFISQWFWIFEICNYRTVDRRIGSIDELSKPRSPRWKSVYLYQTSWNRLWILFIGWIDRNLDKSREISPFLAMLIKIFSPGLFIPWNTNTSSHNKYARLNYSLLFLYLLRSILIPVYCTRWIDRRD